MSVTASLKSPSIPHGERPYRGKPHTAEPASTLIAALRSDSAMERLLDVTEVTSCKFSPDGAKLLVLSNASGSTQVHVIDPKSGRSQQVTDEKGGVRWATWHGNRGIVLGEDKNGNERVQLLSVHYDASVTTPQKAVAMTDDPEVIHKYGGTVDGKMLYASNKRDPSAFDLYIKDLASGKTRMVYQSADAITPRIFLDGGKRVLFSKAYSDVHNDLFLLDLENNSVRNLTEALGPARFHHVTVRGGKMTLITDAGREFPTLARLDMKSSALKYLSNRQAEAEDYFYTRDRRFRVTRYNVDGASTYSIYDRHSHGTAHARNMPSGEVLSETLSRDDRTLVFVLSAATSGATLWKMDVASGEVSPFLPAASGTGGASPSIAPGDLAPAHLVRYQSSDGKRIPAFLYTPNKPSAKPYPAIVYVHGGPESQWRPRFNATLQYLVKRGYVMFTPNIRGSEGYGKTFVHADDVARRVDAIEDVACAARWLSQQAGIDPKRIAVMGGSYGGYMTLAQLAFHPEIWAAGVDIVGMSNLKTFLEHTGPWRRKQREAEYGRLVEDAQALQALSPMSKVRDIRAPLMVVQGANDPRVPRQEADQIVAQVREHGGIAEYLLFKDEGHGIAKRANRVKAYTAVADFLDHHVKGKAGCPK